MADLVPIKAKYSTHSIFIDAQPIRSKTFNQSDIACFA